MSKAYSNENKYEYKIELVNNFTPKDTIVREYSSKFDIGQCWGYNQFVPLAELQNGFLDMEGCLRFNISVRNPTYKSLVRDQENYIKVLQNKLKSNQQMPNNLRARQMISKLSKNVQKSKIDLKKTLFSANQENPQNNSQVSNNSYHPSQQYFNSQLKREPRQLLQTQTHKNNYLSMQNGDNMAMLETDSAEQQYKLQTSSRRQR